MLAALHTIKTYPFDLQAPIFAHYPTMKYGHLESVNHFAELLAPIALAMIADAPATDDGWVLTSQMPRGLPCGANLVCRAIGALLAKELPSTRAPNLKTISVQRARLPINTQAQFDDLNEYAQYDLKRRQQYHSARHERMTYDLANFDGRRAVFVNDINVTGTQLSQITSLLQDAGVKSLDVLLIVNVDRAIGCAFPQLEQEINASRITGSSEFVTFLRDGEFEPTGKLIWRLLSHEPDELAAIVEALQAPKRHVLYRAILQEGLYGGPLFSEKLQIVKRAASGECVGDLMTAKEKWDD